VLERNLLPLVVYRNSLATPNHVRILFLEYGGRQGRRILRMEELTVDAVPARSARAAAKGRGANGWNRKAVTAFTFKAGDAASLAPVPPRRRL
jgi:hypothetical protein